MHVRLQDEDEGMDSDELEAMLVEEHTPAEGRAARGTGAAGRGRGARGAGRGRGGRGAGGGGPGGRGWGGLAAMVDAAAPNGGIGGLNTLGGWVERRNAAALRAEADGSDGDGEGGEGEEGESEEDDEADEAADMQVGRVSAVFKCTGLQQTTDFWLG